MTFVVRKMTRDEMDFAVDWAAAEGWNPGLNDAEAFFASDPNGYFVGELDGEIIGCISAVRYPEDFGFIGFYIVKPEYRGSGHGIQIWNQGIRYLDGCTIGLDGVVEQQANYAKSGFELAYRNARYEGTGLDATPDLKIVPADSLPVAELIAFDRRFFPSVRPEFLSCWLTMNNARASIYLDNGAPLGLGVIRECREGFKIGPLYANNPDIAAHLYEALAGSVANATPVYLDVPEMNPDATALAESYALNQVFETARMYKGAVADVELRHVYGVTTFELG